MFTPTLHLSSLLAVLCLSEHVVSAPAPPPNPFHCPQKSVFHRSYRNWSLPLDQKFGPYDFNQWAYRPMCVVENRETLREGERPGIFCLFTNTFFGPNGGISVLARPDDIAGIEHAIWEAYQSTFPSDETVQQLNLEPAFKVVDMPEKGGKGVVATRHIKQFETFLVDYTAIMADASMWGAVAQTLGFPILDRAADQLLDPTVVLNLSYGAGGQGVDGIVKSNTFKTILNGVAQKALYPVISRINHACQPNAMLRFSHGGLLAGVAAFRDIEPGEEITISYVSLTDTLEERTSKLQGWNFTCTCALCTAPHDEAAKSDERRKSLTNGIDVMIKALEKGDLKGAIETLQQATQSMKDEGLEGMSSEIYEGLARILHAMGNKKKARQMARKAVDFHTDFGEVLEPRDRAADVEEMIRKFDE